MIIANTLYLGTTTFIRADVMSTASADILANVEKYVFMYNCVAFAISSAFKIKRSFYSAVEEDF